MNIKMYLFFETHCLSMSSIVIFLRNIPQKPLITVNNCYPTLADTLLPYCLSCLVNTIKFSTSVRPTIKGATCKCNQSSIVYQSNYGI